MSIPRVAIIGPESLPVPPILGGGIQDGIWSTVFHFTKIKPLVFSGVNPQYITQIKTEQIIKDIPFYTIVRKNRRSRWLQWRYLQFNEYFPYVYQIAEKLNVLKPHVIHIRSRCWYIPLLQNLLTFKPIYLLQHHNHYFESMSDKLVKYYLEKIDGFIGVSEFTTNIEVLNRFPQYKHKCFTIHNGIDLKLFRPKWEYDPSVIIQQKKDLALNQEDKVIVFVGRLSPQKGVKQLLQAVLEVLPAYPRWKLMIVGSSWFGNNDENNYTRDLKKLGKKLGDQLVFTGFVPKKELSKFYAISDLFCLPSIMEDPSPNVCYEAQASGLPILCSNRGGIPEIVKEGETAIFFDNPENYLDIAKKLGEFIYNFDRYTNFGLAGRQRVEENFSWQKTAKKAEAIYSRFIDEVRVIDFA